MPAVLTNGAQQLSGQWAVGSLEVTADRDQDYKVYTQGKERGDLRGAAAAHLGKQR